MTTAVFAPPRVLTEQQVQQFRTDGYVVVPNLLTSDEIDNFVAQQAKPKPAEWNLGLQSHKADPNWKYVSNHPRVAGGAAQLLGGRPFIVQSMFLNKAAGGQGIALHQDTHYLPSEPNTLMACWLALTDTDGDNGGLCIVPGSQRDGLHPTRKNEGKDHVSWEVDYDMRDRDGREYKQKMYSFEITDLDMSKVVKLTVPRGAGVYFTGMTIHGSFANQSPTRLRSAFAVHYVREGTWLLRRDVQETVPAM
ncbi:MAG: phytanoyl-CoA dioxygenase family protein [Planctomycetota bacterium]|nr:phytanoyl-CoA dioxygenase family protein [Planctomycetota bacterium]